MFGLSDLEKTTRKLDEAVSISAEEWTPWIMIIRIMLQPVRCIAIIADAVLPASYILRSR